MILRNASLSPRAICHHLSELLSKQRRLLLAEVAGYVERCTVHEKAIPVEFASALIDEKINELGDWHGKTLANVSEIVHAAHEIAHLCGREIYVALASGCA